MPSSESYPVWLVEEYGKREEGPRVLLVRILGNDLPGLHGKSQTARNLSFTLEHEPELEGADKAFLLNRITDADERRRLREIISSHGARIREIPANDVDICALPSDTEDLYPHLQYLVNNNGARNEAVRWARDLGYEWAAPLDSNAFFTRRQWRELWPPPPKARYLVVPQLRIAEADAANEELLRADRVEDLQKTLSMREPQIMIRRDAPALFNDRVPYGNGPKAELLRVLGVPGEWDAWATAEKEFGVPDRARLNADYSVRSSVFRLHPGDKGNHFSTNGVNRRLGVRTLAREARRRC